VSILTLEQIRIEEGDRVVVTTKAGSTLTGLVVDASDQSKLRVRLDSGREVYIGRGAVELLVD
jgi:translation initiation factor IF-1